ncbi:MAG: HAMP domain-containing sensor histidine kinase [Elusimicrobiota bacterium]
MILPIIFITGAGYKMSYPLALIATLTSFIGVVLLEFLGWISPLTITPEKLYSSPSMTFLAILSICGHMTIAAFIYKITILKLREKVAADAEKERSLLSQMIRLDAKAQAGHLAAGFAHDIKGPITTVFGFTDSVRGQGGLPKDLVELSESIDREMHRVASMVDRMIQSAKPGTGDRTRVCARALMEELVKIGSLLPDAKGVKFREVFPEDGDLGVLADLNELKQAYFNLLKNAVEALRWTESPKIVTVEVSVAGPRVSIEVADNGPGIPAELLPRLLTDSVSGKEDGTGLGLLLVKDILEAHGGTISIHSELGLGTRVFTSLPLEVS